MIIPLALLLLLVFTALVVFIYIEFIHLFLQCIDSIGWATGRVSAFKTVMHQHSPKVVDCRGHLNSSRGKNWLLKQS